jgi:hypothetical protein
LKGVDYAASHKEKPSIQFRITLYKRKVYLSFKYQNGAVIIARSLFHRLQQIHLPGHKYL